MFKILSITLLNLLIICFSQAQTSKIINIPTAGTLSTLLTTQEKSTITDLTVTGNLDARDFKCMRDEMVNLAVLDISTIKVEAFTGIGGTYPYQTSYTYPANEIPASAFHIDGSATGKILLKTINFPTTITSIAWMAFYGCNNLTNLIIPTGVTKIDGYAFCYCHGLLGSLTIGNNITTLGEGVFENCNGLTEFIVANNHSSYSGLDGILYDKNKYKLIQCPTGKSGSITIPNTVNWIGLGAFRECLKLTGDLVIPSSVSTISEHAFSFCTGLTGDVVIPESVNFIGGWAFYRCSGFQSFRMSSITPPTLAYTYCFLETTWPIKIPIGSLLNYRAANEWSEYSSRFEEAGTAWTNNVATKFAAGDGTQNNPYQISNASELAYLAQQVNDVDSYINSGNNYSLGKYFIQIANIDLNGKAYNWVPIGNIENWQFNNKFQGNFDGNNFEIQNMNVDIYGSAKFLYAGLFGYTGIESSIKNLKMSSTCSVKVTGLGVQMHNFAGSIVAYNSGLIENCINSGSVYALTDDSNYAGGIAGHNKGQVKNCYNHGAIKVDGMNMSFKNAGGLIGYNEGTLKDCYNNGAITAQNGIYNNAGGIVASSLTSIEDCYNDGNVTIKTIGSNWNNYLGGVTGNNHSAIINCVNTGLLYCDVNNGWSNVGGISGSSQGKIQNCYNTGNISGSNTSLRFYGGIAGRNVNSIENSYNSGNITNLSVSNYAGGLVGDNDGSFQNCYWFSTVNNGLSAIGRGLTNNPNSTTFNADGSLSEIIYLENTNTGVSYEYLLSSLNAWILANTSTSNTAFKTWMSINSFNNGFPIYGTSRQIPLILTQPLNQSVLVSQKATFNVLVQSLSEPGALSYKWQVSTDGGNSWSIITGATNDTYTTENLSLNDNNNKYRCVIINTYYNNEIKTNSKVVDLSVTAGTPINLFVNCGANGIVKLNNEIIADATNVSVIKDISSTFTITPSAGYEVLTLTYNGLDVKTQLANNQYTTPPVAENCTLSVTFKKTIYKISVKLGGKGTMNLSYFYGDTPMFDFTPSDGAKIQSVFYNGVDVIADLVDNIYTLPAITANGLLEVVFVSMATGNINNIGKDLKVYMVNSNIITDGLMSGETVSIYNLYGELIKTQRSEGERMVIPAQKNTIYIVKAGSKMFKIIL